MMAAFRETNVKGLESAVEEFAKSRRIFDLFAWQQFLEIHHRNNPDPGYFAVELQLLFDATWTVLTQANPKTDEASKTLTENLKAAIQKAHLDSYMRSGIMYIYYFEVYLYIVFTAIFTRLSVKFKSSKNGTYEWDDIVIRDMTIACFSLALYFLLRELAQFHAMYQLGLQRNWFKDFWNYIDLIASGGTIVLLEYYFRMGPGPEYEHFAGVIALFVWTKVLGFAKAFSQPIATFALMLSTIFKDLFSFIAVLVIILVMFGHAFYLVLSDNEASDGDEIDFTNIGGTAWSLYLTILGTFESSVFTGIWSQTLFLFYSFLVVIILLNVLIAIVSDSYDAVLVTSTELFWRSRLELVAEITTTFKSLLRLDVGVWKERFDEHDDKWFRDRLPILYGFKEDHDWANGKNKVALGVRILFSPVLLGLAIAIFFLWLIPVFLGGAILNDLTYNSYSETKKQAKELFIELYGFDSSNDTSNKKNRLLLVARIIFSPLLVAFTIGFLLLWWLPYSILATILGESSSSDEVKLDLKLDSSNSDWSGRVLDIVRRVNAITSSESAKTNAKIAELKSENQALRDGNDKILKILERLCEKMDLEEDKTEKEEVEEDKTEKEVEENKGEESKGGGETAKAPEVKVPEQAGEEQESVLNPMIAGGEGIELKDVKIEGEK
ncbi:hypothetical protein TrVE_jg11937 [Triparma verrucosa]|uniref:Ion transport domain-containing protein n=1 Tax=Triparma verrucosa TaxID=1606542 RepID=A0A9W7BXG6_9STRA|nr:hypothetical protein TrVE_jg11937 [Triparma verrucosa]